jgi:hypothetical protein
MLRNPRFVVGNSLISKPAFLACTLLDKLQETAKAHDALDLYTLNFLAIFPLKGQIVNYSGVLAFRHDHFLSWLAIQPLVVPFGLRFCGEVCLVSHLATLAASSIVISYWASFPPLRMSTLKSLSLCSSAWTISID